jgi:hypothetical protein
MLLLKNLKFFTNLQILQKISTFYENLQQSQTNFLLTYLCDTTTNTRLRSVEEYLSMSA